MRALVPIPPHDPVAAYVPLPRLNYSGLAHRETLLPPDLSLAWSMQRVQSAMRRQPSPRATCMLRDPAVRIEAELVRRCMRLHRCDRKSELWRIAAQLDTVCALVDRTRVFSLSADHWHILPQSWYVWSDNGDVQCACLLAREPVRVASAMPMLSHPRGVVRVGEGAWAASKAMRNMLVQERLLVESVEQTLSKAALGACYKPQTRPQKSRRSLNDTRVCF